MSTRTALYYPNIRIPDGPWLRRSLLYWDQVASIVPRGWTESTASAEAADMQYLADEGEYRRIDPGSWVHDMDEDLGALLVAGTWGDQALNPSEAVGLYREKFSYRFLEELMERGLAVAGPNSGMVTVREDIARAYMALLAVNLATYDEHWTVPGTDVPEYQEIALRGGTDDPSLPTLEVRWVDALPVPREDVALADIIDFKRRRRDELLHFRQVADELQERLRAVDSAGEVKSVLVSFSERVERGRNDLARTMHDSGIATLAGSMRELLSIKSPALVGAGAIALGHATDLATLPLGATISGLGAGAVVQVGSYLIQERNRRKLEFRDHPLAYLVSAEASGVL